MQVGSEAIPETEYNSIFTYRTSTCSTTTGFKTPPNTTKLYEYRVNDKNASTEINMSYVFLLEAVQTPTIASFLPQTNKEQVSLISITMDPSSGSMMIMMMITLLLLTAGPTFQRFNCEG